jgi:hypothetical protein
VESPVLEIYVLGILMQKQIPKGDEGTYNLGEWTTERPDRTCINLSLGKFL